MHSEYQSRNLSLSIVSRGVTAALAMAVVFALTVFLSQSVQAQKPAATGAWTENVIHNFDPNGADGIAPAAGLIFDARGNLYGTTFAGGIDNGGSGFELRHSPSALGGAWTEKVLYSFIYNGVDGTRIEAGLIVDASGNFYGTTFADGAYNGGTAFELTPNSDAAGGGWTEKVLHAFGNGVDGSLPRAGLIFDAAGNLYGTTVQGGAYGLGTVFELTPTRGGGWTERVLHNFNNNGTDGWWPYAGLIFDASGNLYGTTYQGGLNNDGTVFELTSTGGGGWTEQVLFSFNYSDGGVPWASLIFDAAGNLYGTTYGGGAYQCGGFSCGTVFELSPAEEGGWTEQVLHSFGEGMDGFSPVAGLIFDTAGNLYGTTNGGGAYQCGSQGYGCGIVFELTPTVGGGWTEQVLHNFGNGTDGANPFAGLIFDAAGNLYGTTYAGGAYNFGTAFEISHD